MASNLDFENYLRNVFDVCDEKNLGYISLENLKELGLKYIGGSEEDMVQLIHSLDARGEGIVTFPEFCKGVTSLLRYQSGYNVNVEDDESPNNTNLYLSRQAGASNSISISQDELTALQDSLLLGGESVAECSDVSGHSTAFEDKRISSFTGCGDEEEQFQCSGEREDPETDINESGIYLESNGSYKPSLSSGKIWSSNALACQLHRGGASNGDVLPSNSRRSSMSCDSAEDMYTDMSLEDDVMDLNQKVQLLQQQIAALTDSQHITDDCYTRVKQENASLLKRIHSLEENIRELEIRSEERLKEEERHLRENMAKLEREKAMETENYASRLHSLQKEHLEIKENVVRFKQQIERLKQEKSNLREQLDDTSAELSSLQDEHSKLEELSRRERHLFTHERKANAQLLRDLNQELDDLRRYRSETENLKRTHTPSLLKLPSQYHELKQEVRSLRDENQCLREANEDLQAQLLNHGVREGCNLLHSEVVSLAEELENLSKDEAMETLREQQEVNMKLRNYIDGILLNIVENYPQLLEVKICATNK
ncbi:rab11 family-interacting protein 4A-like isoform X3 [Tachypleus tridentatus]|uniref:rab11 family-interacting protein 4A-like isoform X3 n=1 Tax=Tachypleus tridentatus TaxID=6853 RepID=UPI003FD00DCC